MRRDVRRVLTVLLAVLVVAAGCTAGWLAAHRPDRSATKPELTAEGRYEPGTVPDGEDAVEAAVEALPMALAYDHRSLDEGLADATALMTADFAEVFRGTFDRTARSMVRRQKAVTTAVVRGAGLVRTDGHVALVLVYVNQARVDGRGRKDAPVDIAQSRVLVELERSDQGWKVSGIDPV